MRTIYDYDSDIGCLTVEHDINKEGCKLVRILCNNIDITDAVYNKDLLEDLKDLAFDCYYDGVE